MPEAKSIDDWKKIIDTELTKQEHSDALILLMETWLTENETLSFLNMNAFEHGQRILKAIIEQINACNEEITEEKINAWFSDQIKALNELKKLAEAVPLDQGRTSEAEVDDLLAYVPFTPTKNQAEENARDTHSALGYADAGQNLASFGGGLASASVQETADSIARASHVPSQTLVALRDPLPPNIAAGAHIASVVAGGLNLIIFPIILLRAYLRGEKVTLSRDDIGRLTRSAVTLGLGIAGLIVAPAIAIPLMIASAVFTAGTTLIGLGNFLWERWKLNKTIDAKREQAETLTDEIKNIQKRIKSSRDALNIYLKQSPLIPQAIANLKNQLSRENAEYARKFDERTKIITELKTLTQNRTREGTVRQILPRSLGFVVAATIIAGAVLLLVPPLAPIGIGIIIGGAAAGVALMAGVITSHVLLARKGAEKEKLQNTAQLEKQRTKITHETTLDFAKALGIAMKTHEQRIEGITNRLNIILKEIQFSPTPEAKNNMKIKLIKFFVTYCNIHQDDTADALRARPIFNDVPENTRTAAFNELRTIVNQDKGKLITSEDLAVLQKFDKKHDFFHAHGVGVEFVKPTVEGDKKPDHAPKPAGHLKSPRPH